MKNGQDFLDEEFIMSFCVVESIRYVKVEPKIKLTGYP